MTALSVTPDSGRGARSGPPLPPAMLAGFVVAVLAIVLIALFTYNSLQSRSITAGLVTRTVQTLEQLESLISTLLDAETGQRGFLLTGTERYLEPYTNATTTLAAKIKSLRNLTAVSGCCART